MSKIAYQACKLTVSHKALNKNVFSCCLKCSKLKPAWLRWAGSLIVSQSCTCTSITVVLTDVVAAVPRLRRAN